MNKILLMIVALLLVLVARTFVGLNNNGIDVDGVPSFGEGEEVDVQKDSISVTSSSSTEPEIVPREASSIDDKKLEEELSKQNKPPEIVEKKPIIQIEPGPIKPVIKAKPKEETVTTSPVMTPVFSVKEIGKDIRKEVDYTGQGRKIINLDIVFENPKLVQKDGEWEMDVYLSAETTDEAGSKASFWNGQDMNRVNVSSPYKLNFGTFVLSQNLSSDDRHIYSSRFILRDANSGLIAEKTIQIDLNF